MFARVETSLWHLIRPRRPLKCWHLVFYGTRRDAALQLAGNKPGFMNVGKERDERRKGEERRGVNFVKLCVWLRC